MPLTTVLTSNIRQYGNTETLVSVGRYRLHIRGEIDTASEDVVSEYRDLSAQMNEAEQQLFDDSLLRSTAEQGLEVMHCAAMLFLGMVDDATTFAETASSDNASGNAGNCSNTSDGGQNTDRSPSESERSGGYVNAADAGSTFTDYLSLIESGEEYIGAPIYFFFALGSNRLTGHFAIGQHRRAGAGGEEVRAGHKCRGCSGQRNRHARHQQYVECCTG